MSMDEKIPYQAYFRMFPEEKECPYRIMLKYSGKFKGFNANVRKSGSSLTFGLSRNWKEVSPDIKIGLIQELLGKILKKKVKTTYYIELYNIFLQKVHLAVPKKKGDPALEASFYRVNERYLLGLLEKPNLVWGTNSIRRLGSYDYGSDMITLSRILEEDFELLDYVMYHEMLHKKHKYIFKNGRSHHHTKAFREEEAKFENAALLEKRLDRVARKNRILKKKGLLSWLGL